MQCIPIILPQIQRKKFPQRKQIFFLHKAKRRGFQASHPVFDVRFFPFSPLHFHCQTLIFYFFSEEPPQYFAKYKPRLGFNLMLYWFGRRPSTRSNSSTLPRQKRTSASPSRARTISTSPDRFRKQVQIFFTLCTRQITWFHPMAVLLSYGSRLELSDYATQIILLFF